QDAAALESKIVVQARGVVLLNDKSERAASVSRGARGFRSPVEMPLAPVFLQGHRSLRPPGPLSRSSDCWTRRGAVSERGPASPLRGRDAFSLRSGSASKHPSG